jgi:hypothetical protein
MPYAVTQLTRLTLGGVRAGPRNDDAGPRSLIGRHSCGENRSRLFQLAFETGAVVGRGAALRFQPLTELGAGSALFFGALAALDCISMALFGDGELALDTSELLLLRIGVARELGPRRFSGGAIVMRRFASALGLLDQRLGGRNSFA